MTEIQYEGYAERSAQHINVFTSSAFFKHLCFGIAILLGTLHYYYVSMLFEKDRTFSHLSELEREMSLRTEMGFYYSYYKTIVNEDQLVVGLSRIMYDRLVEYPKEVNGFNRFNIHPEVLVGFMYRQLEPWLSSADPRVCHLVARGDDLDQVESCVGLAEPIYFYLEVIWWLAGLTVALLVMLAYYLSGSMVGALLAGVQYWANHSDATRVQWAPNERENFAYPFLLLQMWLVTRQLRAPADRRGALGLQVAILIVNAICLSFWQFTQFIFLTQAVIFFVMEQLKIIDLKTLCIFLHSHFCGLHIAVFLQQGNDMLKTSFFSTYFLVISGYSLFLSFLRIKVRTRVDLFFETISVVSRLILSVVICLWLKSALAKYFNIEEDSHVLDILYSKLTDYKTFHTLLYTCSPVFDFLPFSYFARTTHTGLFPLTVVTVALVVYDWFFVFTENVKKIIVKKPKIEDSDVIHDNKETKREKNILEITEEKLDPFLEYLRNLRIDPVKFYHIAQMIIFGVMALMVMRLKLLFTPHMCLVVSWLPSRVTIPRKLASCKYILWALVCFLVGYATIRAKLNIDDEMSHVGEFSDVEQEALLKWIASRTPPGAVLAGPMPLMAAVLLSTRRAVANTPHYEHADARERTYDIYKAYGRFSPHELYKALRKLQVTHLVVQKSYCYGTSRRGCTFKEIWDLEAPALVGRPLLCHRLLTEELEHFYLEYQTEEYAVFRVHDYSVRYIPRLYDT